MNATNITKLLLCLLTLLASAKGAAYVRETGRSFELGNDYLQRVISLKDGHVTTEEFSNRISGRTYPVTGDEFELRLTWERLQYENGNENPWRLTSRDFHVDSHAVKDVSGGGKQLVFELSNRSRSPGIGIRLTYEVQPEERYTRQWLEVRTLGEGALLADYVIVQTNAWPGAAFRLGGFGQPVLGTDLFWGLEYPSGINSVNGESLSLGSYVGLPIQESGWSSPKAVIGVAENGDVKSAFLSYIDHIRARPVRPYVLYNTWYDLQRPQMDAKSTLARVQQLNGILQQKYGLKLDSFVLDDGWDEWSNLWHIDTARFPNGFHGLTDALHGIGSGLGIWYGPVGGYDNRQKRIAAGQRQGMEVESNGQYLCLAGQHYSRYFSDALLEMERAYGINYFKLDGIPFGCNEPDHGHPVGIYSREADERVFIDLLKRLRRQRPDVFLNITTGIWLSPWWLQYADTVWMGGEDSGYLESLPTLSARQSAISYRDAVLYDDFQRHELQFPLSSIMTHGIIRGRHNLLGGARESLSDWTDELVHYASVGNMMIELYITPELLDTPEWDTLAQTIHWAKANQHPLLDNSRMVLGDPARREVYGFVHASPEKMIVTLRNPFARSKTAQLRLDGEAGFPKTTGAYRAKTIYPYNEDDPGRFAYGDDLNVTLGAFEERVIELQPASEVARQVAVRGARYAVEPQGAQEAMIRLYAPAGVTRSIEIDDAAGTRSQEFHFGDAHRQQSRVSLTAPNITTSLEGTTTVTTRLQIPEDFTQATIAFLYEPGKGAANGVEATEVDNGHAVTLHQEDGGQASWRWFSAQINSGTHEISFRVTRLGRNGRLSGWLFCKRRLAEVDTPLTLTGGIAVPSARESLPVANDLEAETVPLLDQVVGEQ